jgi:DeoR family fructose operon transcriptional repressor
MYAMERYRSIVERVRGKGRASVNDLADHLDVAPETIRRDLSYLEKQGLVQRVHGGAIPVWLEPTVDLKNSIQQAEKLRIAKAVISLLPENGTVILDSGTTTAQIVPLIPNDAHLRIITNSPDHAVSLMEKENVEIILAGGRVRKGTRACVDQWAIDTFEGLVADLAIIATNGISLARGLTTPEPAEGAVKSSMIKAAKKVLVVADHTKFTQDHFVKFGEIKDINLIITDEAVDQGAIAQIETTGIKVIRA